jgi:hypothetical protein
MDVMEDEDMDNHGDNPEYQDKSDRQFRTDRSNSSDGDSVRKNLGMNETFARHKKLMKEKIDSLKSEEVDESVGADEPHAEKFKMDKEKAGLVKVSEAFERLNSLAGTNTLKEDEVTKSQKSDKVGWCWKCNKASDLKNWVVDAGMKSVTKGCPGPDRCICPNCKATVTPKIEVVPTVYTEAFERMRGLANLGERRVMSNGMWGNTSTISEVNYTQNADGKPVIAVGAPGSDARNAVEKDTSGPEKEQVPTEKLKSIKATLDKKSAGGTLNNNELALLKKIDIVLKKRGEG